MTDIWRPISEFDPAVHQDQYLFSDDSGNVILGHWYIGEQEPRMAYTGQGGTGDFPIFATQWCEVPRPEIRR